MVDEIKEGSRTAQVLRFFYGLLIVVLVGLLGYRIGGFLPTTSWIAKGIAIVGGQVCIATLLKDALNVLPKFLLYVRTGGKQGLFEFSSFILVTAVSFTVLGSAVPVVVAAVQCMSSTCAAGGAAQGGPSDATVKMNPVFFVHSPHNNFSVPFPNEAEFSDDDKGNCKETDKEFIEGAEFVPTQGKKNADGTSTGDGSKNFIAQLTKGLSDCSVQGRRVRVEITGYASSSIFGGCINRSKSRDDNWKVENSNRLNLSIANLRARKVCDEMMKSPGACDSANSGLTELVTPTPSRVRIALRQWTNEEFGEMRAGAHFHDETVGKREGDTVKDRGNLTRRVDISVTDAGDCEPR